MSCAPSGARAPDRLYERREIKWIHVRNRTSWTASVDLSFAGFAVHTVHRHWDSGMQPAEPAGRPVVRVHHHSRLPSLTFIERPQYCSCWIAGQSVVRWVQACLYSCSSKNGWTPMWPSSARISRPPVFAAPRHSSDWRHYRSMRGASSDLPRTSRCTPRSSRVPLRPSGVPTARRRMWP